MFTGRQTLR